MSAVVLLALLVTGSPQSMQEAAKQHRDAGNDAFAIAQYDRAIEEFKRAYELEPDARLFYNLGLAHMKRHELAPNRADVVQARDYFKRFLTFVKPEDQSAARLRELATGYVERLETELAKPAAPPPPQIVEVSAPPPPIDHTVSITVLGSSAAFGIAAVVTGILAVRSSNRAFASVNDGDLDAAQSSSDRARHFALATDVLLVGGLLAGATGLILYFLEGP